MSIVPKILELKGPDPETAFRETQQEARHIYGHSGQTGSIADVDGCIPVSGPALLLWDCRRAAQQVLREGHAQPGGPVFLLRLADPKRTRTVKTLVEITGLTPGQVDDAIDAAVRAKLPNDDWGILEVERRGADADGDDRKGIRKTKTIITPGAGPKVTKYIVCDEADGRELSSHPTLPEAKAWMKQTLDGGAAPMVCLAVTQKESGPLLHGRTQTLKETIIAVATIGIPRTEGNGTYLAAGLFTTGA